MRSTLVSAPFVHAAVGWSNVWRSIRSSWTASFSSVASLWKFFLLELSLADSGAEDPGYNCDLFYFSPASLLAFPSYIHFLHMCVWCACMYVCVHIWRCMCIGVHMHMCGSKQGGLRLTLSIFLGCSPLYTLRVSHWTWSPPIMAGLASQLLALSIPICAAQVLGLQTAAEHTQLLHGFWGSDSCAQSV